jgi:hypothetical protein
MLLAAGLLSGCGALVAGTAGGIAGSEIAEDDDNFDPLEETAVGEPLEDAGDAVGDAYDDASDAVSDGYEEVTE